MATVFNLSAAFDKAAYNAGDTMTITVSGSATSGSNKPVNATISIVADDGTTTSLTASSVVNGTADEGWKAAAVVDADNRTWAISSDGHSASSAA